MVNPGALAINLIFVLCSWLCCCGSENILTQLESEHRRCRCVSIRARANAHADGHGHGARIKRAKDKKNLQGQRTRKNTWSQCVM